VSRLAHSPVPDDTQKTDITKRFSETTHLTAIQSSITLAIMSRSHHVRAPAHKNSKQQLTNAEKNGRTNDARA